MAVLDGGFVQHPFFFCDVVVAYPPSEIKDTAEELLVYVDESRGAERELFEDERTDNVECDKVCLTMLCLLWLVKGVFLPIFDDDVVAIIER